MSLKDHLEIDLYKDFPPCLRLLFANVVQVVVLLAEVIILVTWVILVQGHVSLVLGTLHRCTALTGGYLSNVLQKSDLTWVATYGHISVPLVYTQVVTLAVYFYF